MSAYQGFSLLLWVRDDSPRLSPETLPLEGDDDLDLDRVKRELLNDCCVLLGMRWSLECTISSDADDLFAFVSTTRFTVSGPTIERGLGELSRHIAYIRGSSANTFQDLVKYKRTREKWKVTEISDSSTGQEQPEQPGTSLFKKRQRY